MLPLGSVPYLVHCGGGRDVSNVVHNALPLPASLGLLAAGTVGLGLLLLKGRTDGLAVQ
jgi:hypothetical protein